LLAQLREHLLRGREVLGHGDFTFAHGAQGNIADTFEFGEGWWDYVELVRRSALRLDSEDVRVIGHYVVETPRPCERLPMPAVAFGSCR